MERLLEILNEIQPEIDAAHCENLIDGQILSSLDILALVAAIEEAFGVTVPAVEVVPENFNSAVGLWSMIRRLSEEG